jgi:Sec-independent protein translocase protein TatA
MSIAEIGLVLFVVLVFLGTWFLHSITKPQALSRSTRAASSTEDTLEEDSIEDSEGDGLMSEGDIMFPPEPDEDED